VDWNSDGKKDILTGENNGNIRIYLNTNTDADPVFSGYTLLQVGGVNFDCGSYSWIHVADWNSDGLLDVLCGESNGTIFLMINEGVLGAPLFNSSSKLKDGASTLDVGSRSSPTVVDLNLDGKKDLLSGESGGTIRYYENIGTDEDPLFNGYAKLSVDGKVIDVGYDPHPDVVDWDDDGILDVITGEFYGSIMVYRAVGPLFLDDNVIEESTGALINLKLTAGQANANRTYLVLGSASGTDPGILLPGGMTTLPLNWDYFTDLVFTLLNSPAFFDFFGTLDANGNATARLQTPPITGYAGTLLHFSYCCNNPFDVVSNPAAVEIVN
jgi:hypothetical protein